MPTEILLAVIVLLLPLVAFAIQILVGKRLPRGGDWVSLSAIFAGLGISTYLFVTRMLLSGDPHLAYHWSARWIELGPFHIDVGINLDNMCFVMLMIVTVVSSVVHLYSVGYMKGDIRYSRYFAFLSLFSFSMLELVLADSLILIYVGWELVGLCSYLLIGFWYEKDSAANAGKKAFIVNRIGDAGFFIGIMMLLVHTGTTNLSGIFEAVAAGAVDDQKWEQGSRMLPLALQRGLPAGVRVSGRRMLAQCRYERGDKVSAVEQLVAATEDTSDATANSKMLSQACDIAWEHYAASKDKEWQKKDGEKCS